MKLVPAFAAILCLTGSLTAQDNKGPFAISINRPCKAGDKFSIRSLAQIATTTSTATGGPTAGANLERQAILLEGDMEVQAVTPKEGQPSQYRIQITKCVAGEKAGAANLLPAGTEITMELDPAKAPLLKVAGKPAMEPLQSLLKSALPIPATEDIRREDQVFGHADKKAEDDEWQPAAATVAAAFKKKGFSGAESAIKTRARLTEVTDWDEIPCILVKGNVDIHPCDISGPGPKAAATKGDLSFTAEYYLPLDASLPMTREKTETRVSTTLPLAGSTAKTEKVTWVTRVLKKK